MPPRGRVGNQGTSVNEQLVQNLQQLTQLTEVIGNALLNNNNRNGQDAAWLVAGRHPPNFLGQEDPLLLEDWIRAFDKIFEAVDCPLERRVEIAAYYLQQEADNWWATEGPVFRQELGFGWNAFKDKMRDRFYPEHVKSAKYEEFLHLKQGGMTVQEYHSQFLELARFAPMLVPDEPSKARKFVNGLNYETQKAVCVFSCQTLSEAYNRAAKHFCVQQIQRGTHDPSKRKVEGSSRPVEKKLRADYAAPAKSFPRGGGSSPWSSQVQS